jgi:hypothetical protein
LIRVDVEIPTDNRKGRITPLRRWPTIRFAKPERWDVLCGRYAATEFHDIGTGAEGFPLDSSEFDHPFLGKWVGVVVVVVVEDSHHRA